MPRVFKSWSVNGALYKASCIGTACHTTFIALCALGLRVNETINGQKDLVTRYSSLVGK